jgi:hypothetical protein
MDRRELQNALRSPGVRANAYDLWGRLTDESYGLRQDENRWRVVYRERGHDRGLHAAGTEDQACRWMLEKILSDPTSTQSPGGGPG